MRICHVITRPELGGAQLSTLNLIYNLPKDKYQISVITSPDGLLNKEFKGLKHATVYFSPLLTGPINPIADILALINIYVIYRCKKYKIIHTHSSKAGILGRWAGFFARVPVILHTVHGWPFNNYQNILKRWFFIFLERITAAFTDKIICVSKRDIETGVRYRIAPREKFVLIKYGIPLDEFRKPSCDKAQKKKDLGINNNFPVIGMISCLKPQKSPMDYIRACIDIHEKHLEANFLLIGGGILKERCKRELKCSSLNGHFIFTGWRRDIPELLDIIDILVLTSKWEGLSIAIIEALARGKPVVATDAGGARELLKNGVTGYITRPGEYKEISERVSSILKDRSIFLKMSEQAARSIDDSFDISAMAQNIDNLYRRLA